nr:MetaGeneMark_Unknown Function [uncultured bacterium]
MEAALLALVLGTVAWCVYDFAQTGAGLSMWMLVLLGALAFAPLIRRWSEGAYLITTMFAAFGAAIDYVDDAVQSPGLARADQFVDLERHAPPPSRPQPRTGEPSGSGPSP